MPGRALSPSPLTVTLVAAVWVSVGRYGTSEAPGPKCDNGKLYLERDLALGALHWDCAKFAWPEATQRLSCIDSVYDPEPAKQICMDKPISHNHTLPSSGAYRPVRAESGEYLYCPPQRWLNNLHHGSAVLLYHPCAPLRERHLLSGLARSCLPDFIMTPHPQLNTHTPIALVSWGRTLELSSVASSDICDWLVTSQTDLAGKKFDGAAPTMKYDLLLTWSAKQQRPEQPPKIKESLRQCCEQTISSLLNRAADSGIKKEGFKDITSRQIRAASGGMKEGSDTTNNISSVLNNETNTSISQRMRNAQKSSSILEPRPTAPSGSNISTFTRRNDSLGFGALQPTPKQTDLKKPDSPVRTHVLPDGRNSEQNHTATPEALTVGSKKEGTDSGRHNEPEKHGKKLKDNKQKSSNKKHAADLKMKDNKVIDVKEREVEHKQRHSPAHTHHKSRNAASDFVSRSQQNSHATSPNASGTTVGIKGLPRTPRTDEAVWAAAALGFLLVLLTLSVLQTRLYRYWRTAPSLYWHDPRQDYDSVADVIRRRLKIAKRRKKRSRRQECVLLPSSSSSDEHP